MIRRGDRRGGIVFAVILGLTGCGSDGDGAEAAEVRAAVVEFARGLTGGSAERLAATMLPSCRPYADLLVETLEVSASSRHIEIAAVEVERVDGSHAEVSVRFNGDVEVGGVNVQTSPLSIGLDLDGDHWLVDCESLAAQ